MVKPTEFGSGNWLFIEDNYWVNWSSVIGAYAIGNCGTDAYYGDSVVIRYNHMFDINFSDYGTQGAPRGARKREICNNHLYNSQAHAIGGSRSGPTLIHDNILIGVSSGD